VFAPFIGIPPGFYRLHHVYMHHVENNFFETDLSSTEMYQRDSKLHFLHYVYNYLTCVFKLPYWAIKYGHWDLFFTAFAGFGAWGTLMVLSWMHSPIFCFYTWILPFCVLAFVMMLGNFS